MAIRLKRAYDDASSNDGLRVLVDRVWPRGVSKEAAHIDLWLKDIAPSSALRKWFGHDRERWREFRRRYFRELGKKAHLVKDLAQREKRGRVTLVFGARDEECNNAVALKQYFGKHKR